MEHDAAAHSGRSGVAGGGHRGQPKGAARGSHCMGIVLDTSILIAAARRALRFEALLESLGDEPVAISAITASELLHGCHRATSAGVRARRSAFVEALLDAIPVLPFGLGEARLHAEIWAELARQGTVIGPHDLLIA